MTRKLKLFLLKILIRFGICVGVGAILYPFCYLTFDTSFEIFVRWNIIYLCVQTAMDYVELKGGTGKC